MEVFVQTASSGGSSTAGALTKNVAQTAHGFTVGQVLRRTTGGTYVTAKADAAANADTDVMVYSVTDANNFVAALPGSDVPGLSGLTDGNDYFLDPTTAGAITATAPSTPAQVVVPVGKAISTTEIFFAPKLGLVVPSKAQLVVPYILLQDATALAVAEDFGGVAPVLPSFLNGYSIAAITWTVATVSSSGLPSLGIRKNSTEVLTTNVTIDANETTSDTAATPAVIKSDGSQTFATGDVLHFDCDAAGTGTKGSIVYITWQAP